MEKKSYVYSVIILIAILVISSVIYFVFFKRETVLEEPVSKEMTEQEKEIHQQLEELDLLYQQTNPQPPTQEEIQSQVEELDSLHQQTNPQPPTQEEIQRQLEELDRLRS